MKKIFMILTVLIMTVGCQGEKGSLSVAVKASKANPALGEKVSFTVEVPDTKTAEEISGNWYVFNSNNVQLAYESFTGNTFSYTFGSYDDFTVKVVAKNKKNYGTGIVLVTVADTSGSLTWNLAADSNSNSFMAGEPIVLSFENLKKLAGNGAEVDVHLVNEDTGAIPFFQNNIGDQIQYMSSSTDNGNYKIVCVVKYPDGSRISTEDQLILMDPNNPIELLISASKNDKNYEDTIYVSGSALHQLGVELTTVKLIRTCYYGKESGVYPLASLNEDGGIKSYKSGDFITIEEVYTPGDGIFKYDATTGKFDFIDPMNYYDENGQVEERGFKWSYAKLDREAWKSVLRKKYFNLEQAVSVSYKIVAASATQPDAEISSAVVKGYPYINKVSLCQILFWYKDAALNRLWHMQCPRWCWKQTASWLLNAQSYSGLKSGKVAYTVSGFSGEGYLQTYSDWDDVSIFTNGNISTGSISLSSNQRKEYTGSFTVQTGIYGNIKMDINKMSVRDMVLQYGLWTEGGAGGTVTITRPEGIDTVSAEDLTTFMPQYEATPQNKIAGNGYEDWDDTGAGFDLLREGMSWTMFNFKYPPLKAPTSDGGYSDIEYGNWGNRESEWEMRYDVSG